MLSYLLNGFIILIAVLTFANMDHETRDDKILIGLGFFSYFILSNFNLTVVLIIAILDVIIWQIRKRLY